MCLPIEPGGGAHTVSERDHGICVSSFYYTQKVVLFTQDTELWHQEISHLLHIPKVVRISKDNQFRLIHSRRNVQVRQCSRRQQQEQVSELQ